MPLQQQIQNCIQQCVQTANQLRTLANQAPDSVLRDRLTEGSRHIELCIKECEFATQRAQQFGQPGAFQQPGQLQQMGTYGPFQQAGQWQPYQPAGMQSQAWQPQWQQSRQYASY